MTLDDDAIQRLVAASQQGDPEAFGSLFDAFYGPVYRYVAARVGRPSDAEDLAQLVFVKALEALPRYEARGVPFGGWLFRLARNATIDHVRTHHEHVELGAATDRAADESGPEVITILRTDLDAVAAALGQLTPDQREVVSLRFFAGLSSAEVGAVTGRQEGAVRGLQFRAIATLRRTLGVDAEDRAGTA